MPLLWKQWRTLGAQLIGPKRFAKPSQVEDLPRLQRVACVCLSPETCADAQEIAMSAMRRGRAEELNDGNAALGTSRLAFPFVSSLHWFLSRSSLLSRLSPLCWPDSASWKLQGVRKRSYGPFNHHPRTSGVSALLTRATWVSRLGSIRNSSASYFAPQPLDAALVVFDHASSLSGRQLEPRIVCRFAVTQSY
jgi:hypothetical protein